MKRLPQTFGVRIVKLVFSCSWLALAVGLAHGADYRELQRRLDSAKDPREVVRIVKSAQIADGDLQTVVQSGDDRAIRDAIDLRAMAQEGESGGGSSRDAATEATRIKADSRFVDRGTMSESNWLSDAMSRLQNLGRVKEQPRKVSHTASNSGPGGDWSGIGTFFLYAAWLALAGVLALFLLFALRHFGFKGRARRKVSMLEEDEPALTLDEWLSLADEYSAKGMYREAVRALYLASLMLFDHAKVARFVRSETNWEHLRRIDESPTKPAGLDFYAPTRAFDTIWYGHRVDGAADVDRFRAWYVGVKTAVAEGPQ